MQSQANFDIFRAEVKKQLVLRHWRYKDLAQKIGYSENSVTTFMSVGNRDNMAKAIAAALDIPEYMTT